MYLRLTNLLLYSQNLIHFMSCIHHFQELFILFIFLSKRPHSHLNLKPQKPIVYLAVNSAIQNTAWLREPEEVRKEERGSPLRCRALGIKEVSSIRVSKQWQETSGNGNLFTINKCCWFFYLFWKWKFCKCLFFQFCVFKTLKMVIRVDIYLKTFCIWMNIMPQ